MKDKTSFEDWMNGVKIGELIGRIGVATGVFIATVCQLIIMLVIYILGMK